MANDFADTLKKFVILFDSASEPEDILLQTCKLLKENISHYNWVGFYLFDVKSGQLILGPYMGKPTDHITIPIGKGVCGQVAKTKMLKVVQDVNKEDNYISCSINVRSEIVVPILKNGEFVAEIDIDSHSSAPFTKADEDFLTKICEKISLLF
jgi:L-methionine (R)-S-oxide reductase